jgi:intracellular multiplication protein IcmS
MVDEIMDTLIGKKMALIAKNTGCTFTLKGREITLNEVFSSSGLLPGLSKRADQLASLCFGYGIGTTFDDTENSILGVKVNFDDYTPEVIRLMCLTDVLFELIKANPSRNEISLDELLYD